MVNWEHVCWCFKKKDLAFLQVGGELGAWILALKSCLRRELGAWMLALEYRLVGEPVAYMLFHKSSDEAKALMLAFKPFL